MSFSEFYKVDLLHRYWGLNLDQILSLTCPEANTTSPFQAKIDVYFHEPLEGSFSLTTIKRAELEASSIKQFALLGSTK